MYVPTSVLLKFLTTLGYNIKLFATLAPGGQVQTLELYLRVCWSTISSTAKMKVFVKLLNLVVLQLG